MKINSIKYYVPLLGVLFLINQIVSIKLNSKSVPAETNSINITKSDTNATHTEKKLGKQDNTTDNYTLIARVESSSKTNVTKENNQLYIIENGLIKVNTEGLSEPEINLIKNILDYISQRQNKLSEENINKEKEDKNSLVYHPHLVDAQEIISYIKNATTKTDEKSKTEINEKALDEKQKIYETPTLRKSIQTPIPQPIQSNIVQNPNITPIPQHAQMSRMNVQVVGQENNNPQVITNSQLINNPQVMGNPQGNQIVTKDGIVTNSIQRHNNDVILVSNYEKPLPSLKPMNNGAPVQQINLPELQVAPIQFMQKSSKKKSDEKQDMNKIMMNYYFNTEGSN